jgi:DNA repair photolyase
MTNETSSRTMNGKTVHSVPARSVINFDSGFKHKLLCDGPTLSTGSACAYSCTFCYVEDLMRKNPHWQSVRKTDPAARFEEVVIRREGAVEAMRRQLTDAKGRPKFNDPLDRRVIYGSPLVDIAANMVLARETIEVCKTILELTHWDVRLLSKSNLLPKVADGIVAADPHVPNATSWGQRVIFGVSTGTLNDKIAAAFEQGTPLVSKRIQSLHWLQDNGFRTYAMVCPSLPQADYDQFAREMAEALRYDRCEHVWAEVINLRGESFTRTFDALGNAALKDLADAVKMVSTDKTAWENYARSTFLAHSRHVPAGKLRFLQYVTKKDPRMVDCA